jgi:Domain of unknown function (DUF4360)
MKKMLVLMALLTVSTLASAQSVTIRGVRLSGSGCGPATASAVTTADGKTLSVIFDNYSAEIGNGSANPQATSIQKDCRVMIDVDVPAGFQYALEQTDYRGFVAMPASAYGMHRFVQNVPSQPIVSMREAQLKGPINQNYAVSIKQKPGRYIYSACNSKVQTIDLMSQLMVAYLPNTKDRSIAMINLDTIDTNVASSFQLSWRRCQ